MGTVPNNNASQSQQADLPVQHLPPDDQGAVSVFKIGRGVNGVLADRLASRIDRNLRRGDFRTDRRGSALQRVRLPLGRLGPANAWSDVHVVQAEVRKID